MVRTYAHVNATSSRVGELFDLVVKESEQAQRTNSGASVKNINSNLQTRHHVESDSQSSSNFKRRPNSVPLEPRPGWTETRQPIKLPLEEAVFVEPVFGGNNQRRNPGSYYDYERQMREQDRQQRQQYMHDLQRQLEDQREQRLRSEIALGGHEFERELLKQQRQRRASYSSSRNRDDYNPVIPMIPMNINTAQRNRELQSGANFGYNMGNSTNGIDYDKYLRAAELQHKREYAAALEQQNRQNQQYDNYNRPPKSNGYTPTFANNGQFNPTPFVNRREQSVPNDLNLFDETATTAPTTIAESTTYDPLSLKYMRGDSRRQSRTQKRSSIDEPDEIYDPWGKGGAGAPIRDRTGKLVADRRQLQKSWTSMVDTNLPHDSSQNRSTLASQLREYNQNREPQPQFPPPTYADGPSSYPGSAILKSMNQDQNQYQHQRSIGAAAVNNEKDWYKDELRKQIEEQKRYKELEKEKERLEDERDRLRMEREAEKQRREIEEERKKQQQKTERGLRRADQAEVRAHDMERKNRDENPHNVKLIGHRNPNSKLTKAPADDGLEWWERQAPSNQLTRSQSIDDLRKKPPTPNAASETADRRKNPSRGHAPVVDHHRSASPISARRISSPNSISNSNSNLNSQPRNRSATARNEQILRQLSAMRERLNKEQIRVRSAIRRREYGEDLFDDDQSDQSSTRPSKHGAVAAKNSQRMQHGNRVTTYNGDDDDDDDPPLVKLIKNSRTFDSAELRNPPPLVNNSIRDKSPPSDNPEAVLDHFIDHRNRAGY